METVAVVCDDNIECAEARDEALCKTGARKYNPLVYTMTILMGLVYVVLKLVWFFHLQHQPVGDEEDDMAMEEMETNQYREVTIKALFLIKKIVNNPCQEMEAGPSSEDSRYWKAL